MLGSENITNPYLVRCFKEPEYLLQVLNDNYFTCRYSIEEFSNYFNSNKFSKKLGVPMVCFCDVPELGMKTHKLTYGDYVIYMKKEWGVNNQLLPIHYVHNQNDNHIKSLQFLYDYLLEGTSNKLIENVLVRLLSYTKYYKSNKKDEVYYNEREWRFIPNDFSAKDLVINYNNSEQSKLAEMESSHLKFKKSDIIKIVIPNNTKQNAVSEIIKKLDEYKFQKTFCENENQIVFENNNQI